MGNRITWPQGKDFAFTVFDDADYATIENVADVYSFLSDRGFRTTKSVWPLRGAGVPLYGGATCEDKDYLKWVLGLKDAGFEIGYHMATYHSSDREETRRGIDRFRELFGQYPKCMANHSECRENIYWGSDRLSGFPRLFYNMATRYRNHKRYFGHVVNDAFFWGDLCQESITYVRNFVFQDTNTLKACPIMPYHDPLRPYVNYWFASSEGARVESFNRCIEEQNQDRLEGEGGACIMYTHFASGFCDNKSLNSRFRFLMERLSKKNGWFVSVSSLLDYLRDGKVKRDITDKQRRQLELRWLCRKFLVGKT